VFDPTFYGTDRLSCDARIQFLHECLSDLESQYSGNKITFAHGDPLTVLDRFVDSGWDIVATADPTGRYGWERDNRAAAAHDTRFIDGDGLDRTDGNSREHWSDHIDAWFTGNQYEWSDTAVDLVTADSPVTIDTIESAYGIDPEKSRVPVGGRTAATRRLDRFIQTITEYPRNISAPVDAEMGTSRLSPYLRFGCLSVRELYQAVQSRAPECRGRDMFISRLYWNRHYNQKLEDWHGWMDQAVNPAMEGFNAETYDPELVRAWKQGATGYPMVDASMRCLRSTGWLNFRMRAMCASFLCDILTQPWKIGADWFYYHLIDADPAINYTQFQTQASVVGVNMMRIYNPRKQVRENDPNGEFCTEWVPELESLPTEHLDRPERTPISVQDECGVSIGEDYPYPIVEYERARHERLAALEAVRPKARQALEDDEIRRRASLSRGGRVPDTDERNGTDDQQSSLSDF
jgi:deoxyribodipyrimidine photo-lyase